MKKIIALLTAAVMLLTTAITVTVSAACSAKPSDPSSEVLFPADLYSYKYQWYSGMSPEEIAGALTLEQKAAQMVQPAVYQITEDDERKNDYGSILSTTSCIDAASWRGLVDGFQQAAIESEAGIPYIYGQDDVHGVNYCLNAVYFPHNIGQGAANDEELAYQVGLITADEAKLCHMMWNFSPCVAQSVDPRWGRTYESYGSDLETVKKLSTAYTKGLIDGGIVACAKHFFADGNVVYGTGEQGDIKMLIDRGDAQLSDAEIKELLKVYQAQIDAGVQTIMISHSSLNGVKMHENKEYIMKLKDEMGFQGFIVSDWGSVGNITGSSYREKVIKSVNAGIDMLMETDRFEEARKIIVKAVKKGDISEERVNDAVTRIIRVKKDMGLFDDPMLENIQTVQDETGSPEYRAVAEKLVEKSLVLLKNNNGTLPLRDGAKVYITGPAADNGQAQCGGWTMSWNSAPSKDVPGCTTILEAFGRYAADYGIEIITDAKEANKADVVLLCVGEQSYAEWYGDTEDLMLCGKLGLDGNRKAIEEAKALDKPTVACIIAGRNVIIDPKDYDGWDAAVMCYLPGSEGKGISDVLCGCADFEGRLPSPWYGSVDQIGTGKCFLEYGYGLSYGEGFTPRKEPAAFHDNTSEVGGDGPMSGTGYTKGLFKDGVYVNKYAGLQVSIPGNIKQDNDSDIEWIENFVLSLCTDEKDIKRQSAQIIDSYFESDDCSVSFEFLNTGLGVPDDPDYTPEDYLDDNRDFYMGPAFPPGSEIVFSDRKKVTLGGHEYMRDACDVKAGGARRFYYDYARKLDEDLMCIIEICSSGDIKPEDCEKWFERFEGSEIDPDNPMSGTGYTKGLFKDGIYVNDYAGIKANIPGGLIPLSDNELERNQQQIVSQCTNDKDRIRESARIIDGSFMGSKDYIVFTFLNTEHGIPDNPSCTEEEYFDNIRDYTKVLADMAGFSLEYEDRVKVRLGDKEYLRETCTVSGNTRFYWYARKLDDDLMCVIEISGAKASMKPEDYESLFM